MNTPQFRFGENEVDPATRQVTHAGRSLRTEPKVFDVLVLLLRQRHRVVTRQELLDAVWGRMVVTDGVIARTVMKARKLIGDEAAEQTMLKTIRRVGYRFVADVEEVVPPPSMLVAGETPAAPGRIAVLPFVDDTGHPQHAWIDLGLMATTVNELAHAIGAAGVVPVADLLGALGACDAAAPLEAIAAKLASALGPVDVVQASLSCAARPGAFTLRFATVGASSTGPGGVLDGPDPVLLSRQLARRIGAALPQARSAGEPPLPLSADARFAAAAQARGLKALHEERWGSAARLLRVALDLLPHDPELQLDHACCLAGQHDPRAPALLQAALSDAREAGHAARELRALHLLATCHHRRGDFAEAERLLGDGLRRAESAGDADAELQLLLSSAQTLTCLDKSAMASWMLDRAEQLSLRLGNPVAMAHLLGVRGRLALYRAGVAGALGSFEAAARLNEQHGLNAASAHGLAHIGHCLLDLGRTADAAAHYLRALDHAERSGNPVAVALCGVCSVKHATPDAADALLARMRRAGAVPAAIALAEAFALGRRGQLRQAGAALDRAEHGMEHSPSFGYHVAVLRIRILVRLGLLDEALELCDDLRARAAGRLQRAMLGSSLHLRALVAAAEGSDRSALALLRDSLRQQGPSMARTEALLDAVWLHLKSGDPADARILLGEAAPFMQAALASGHAPALCVQSAWQATVDAARMMLRDDDDARWLPSLLELRPARPLPAVHAKSGVRRAVALQVLR
ncbi:winged helix-turn-helix domain-containing protein [Rhizobacter sp. OV335]|uniref:winged helix-turn-helix domain-containing protein n=1 Tax=Rhizobacter sp. OV335 TaxID=1500264 RepID=UPI00090FB372|nr:winged helix-turn-helix domain-containing protein [Rhizobacter sp. OV335]SHM25763.1 DNA-binding winged helix-turn-helix (wHTH) domain-containing protein [Rhizobacter sp. OV335]